MKKIFKAGGYVRFNEKFSMQDLFMNKELKGLFPQFTRRDKLQNVYSFEWVDKKVAEYIKSVFNGKITNGEVIIKGKHKERLKQIKGMQRLIEDLFNNMPAITKNIRKNTKLITPFQCIDQLKNISDPLQKMKVMQIVFDNLNYNPNFQSQNRFRSEFLPNEYYRRQALWMKMVGWNKRR